MNTSPPHPDQSLEILLQTTRIIFSSEPEICELATATLTRLYGIMRDRGDEAEQNRETPEASNVVPYNPPIPERAIRHGGKVPYGYVAWEWDTRYAVPCPEEQAVLKWMHKLQRQGYSLRGIADDLNSRTMYNRHNRPWNHTNVRLCLKPLATDEDTSQETP